MATEQRKLRRHPVRQRAKMASMDGSPLGSCLMLDLSGSGAQLMPEPGVVLPDEFFLLLSWTGQLRRKCSVIWRSDTAIGVRFTSNSALRPMQAPRPQAAEPA